MSLKEKTTKEIFSSVFVKGMTPEEYMEKNPKKWIAKEKVFLAVKKLRSDILCLMNVGKEVKEFFDKKIDERFGKGFGTENIEEGYIIYGCGHSHNGMLICEGSTLSISAYLVWKESVGFDGDKSKCFDCFSKGRNMEKR